MSCYNKIVDQKNVRMEGFILARGWSTVHPGLAGMAAGTEAAGHIASANRKQREMNAVVYCPFSTFPWSGTSA